MHQPGCSADLRSGGFKVDLKTGTERREQKDVRVVYDKYAK